MKQHHQAPKKLAETAGPPTTPGAPSREPGDMHQRDEEANPTTQVCWGRGQHRKGEGPR